ncbi:unnamed protein product [Calicophoron daubneyi]|uniref:Aspartyl aminopeptidase n=1 Tax=Calicophoron daubneyi TaxID=300641 RepID=A0AAV2TWE9_CALDB
MSESTKQCEEPFTSEDLEGTHGDELRANGTDSPVLHSGHCPIASDLATDNVKKENLVSSLGNGTPSASPIGSTEIPCSESQTLTSPSGASTPARTTPTDTVAVQPMDFPSAQISRSLNENSVLSASAPVSRVHSPLVEQNFVVPSSVVASTNPSPSVANSTVPKRPRHKPGERRELLTRAVEDVINLNISMRRAAQKYNLAKSSLCDFVRKNKISLPNLRFRSYQNAHNASDVKPAIGSSRPTKRMISEVEDGSLTSFNSAKQMCNNDVRRTNVTQTTQDNDSGLSHSFPQTESGCIPRSADGSFRTDCNGQLNSDPRSHFQSHKTERSLVENNFLSHRSGIHPGSSVPPILSKAYRNESPWHNAAGLPTLVPMRSWSTNTGGLTNGCSLNNPLNFDRKESCNPFSQSQQAVGMSQHLASSCAREGDNITADSEQLTPKFLRSFVDGAELLGFTSTQRAPNTGLITPSSFVSSTSGVSDIKSNADTACSPSECSRSCVHLTPPAPFNSLESDLGCDKIGSLFNSSVSAGGSVDSKKAENVDCQQLSASSTSCSISSSNLTSAVPSSFADIDRVRSSGDGVTLTCSFPSTSFAAPLSGQSSGLGLSGSASDTNLFTRVHGSSHLSFPSCDSQVNIRSDDQGVDDTGTTPDGTSVANTANFPFALNPVTCPDPPACPLSLGSFLPSDFSSSVGQAAVAALLLQHSRGFPPGSVGLPNLPYQSPVSQNVQNLFPNCSTDLGLYSTSVAGLPFTSLVSSKVNSNNTARSTSGHVSSLANSCTDTTTSVAGVNPTFLSTLTGLTNFSSVPDFLQSIGSEDLQQLLCRQVAAAAAAAQQSRLLGDSVAVIASNTGNGTGSSSTTTSGGATNSSPAPSTTLLGQLIPLLSNQTASQTLRHLIGTLIGSLQLRNWNSMSADPKDSVNSPLVSGEIPNTNNTVGVITDPNCSSGVASSFNNYSLFTGMNKGFRHAQGLIDFINKSPSPFHVVKTACDILNSNGFRELKEKEPWQLSPSDLVFVKKNGSALFAAAIGGKFKPGNPFHILGAHTDSPYLRLKPISERLKEGYVELGVETYGGGLWYTWFDRDLKVAGRAVYSDASGRLKEYLVHVNRPIACVPSLAIHLSQDLKTQGFLPNVEMNLLPVLCTSLMEQLNTGETLASAASDTASHPASAASAGPAIGVSGPKRRHPTGLVRLLGQELGLQDQEPLELELYLSDFEPARLGGLYNEFVHAPRLDNQFSCYTGLRGFVDSLTDLADDTCIRIFCMYDHEEVGSTSTQGANSQHTVNLLRRLAVSFASGKYGLSSDGTMEGPAAVSSTHFEESLSKSFLLSADMSHAVHPSYGERYESNHKPQLHGGLVLKCNSNQRYATNGLTAAAVRQLGLTANVPIQEYTNRQDMRCGTTIGPLLSSQLGIPTADVGFGQLAMHSCRELCGTVSADQAVQFYRTYFQHLSDVWPYE